MILFKIIPVIDILNSEVVHAVKGKRTEYCPLRSKLFDTTKPYDIITILSEKYGFNDIYIADLDSIVRKKPNISLISRIIEELDVNLILDPGIIDVKDLHLYKQLKLKSLILGLETIKTFKVIENALKIFEQNKIILSIDMYNGKLISNINEIKNKNPLEVIEKIEKLGINNYILLDLHRVGQKKGSNSQLYFDIRQKYDGNFIVGGGIKDLNEIKIFQREKFAGVIIATALYDGSINIEELKKINQI